MREKNRLIVIVVIALLVLGTAAVFIITGRGDKPETSVVQQIPVEESVSINTEVPTVAVEIEDEPAVTEVAEMVEAPEPKAGLEATDPASVNLASGDIQLVEVFAFW